MKSSFKLRRSMSLTIPCQLLTAPFMLRSLFYSGLLASSAVLAIPSGASAETQEELDKIAEINKRIWSWRRCVNRWEAEHGASKDGKPPEVCGPEPKLPSK